MPALTYRFTLHLNGINAMTPEIADALHEASCDDATPFARAREAGVGFDREAESLEAAITSALADMRSAGFRVKRVVIDPADLPLTAAGA